MEENEENPWKIMGRDVEMRMRKVLLGFNSIDLIKVLTYLFLLALHLKEIL